MLLSFLSCANLVSTMHIWGIPHCGSISFGSVSNIRESVQGQSFQTLLASGNIACEPELVSCTSYTGLPMYKAFSSPVQVNPRQACKLTECFVNPDAQSTEQRSPVLPSETSMVSLWERKGAVQ